MTVKAGKSRKVNNIRELKEAMDSTVNVINRIEVESEENPIF